MKEINTNNLNILEGNDPQVLVVTQFVPYEVWDEGRVMTLPAMKLFAQEAEANGFDKEKFVFVNPCAPIPEESQGSDKLVGDALAEDRDEFLETIADYEPLAIITLGKWALRQLMGKAVQISKARGTIQRYRHEGTPLPLLPLLSTTDVLRFPEHREQFQTDFQQLYNLREMDWSVRKFRENAQGKGYKWTLDIQELLDDKPRAICFDTETIGADRYADAFEVLTVQITRKKGESFVIPLDIKYWNNEELMNDLTRGMPRLNRRRRAHLLRQLKELLEDPDVAVVGHNLKYDVHAMRTLGIDIANWYSDTMQLAFCVDENMRNKGMDDCVRRWIPDYAGYADGFNSKYDKSRMDLVPHTDMLMYSGGDTDVGYRLQGLLQKKAKQDMKNWDTFCRVQMPTLRAFVEMEQQGVRINLEALSDLGEELKQREAELNAKLLLAVPPKVLRDHKEKGWKFTRADFVIDILFGSHGLKFDKDGNIDNDNGKRLRPAVFTKGGKPSISGKDHLPYFDHCEWVRDYMEFKKVEKMISTYVGHDAFETRSPVKRLKKGNLPKPVRDALETYGLEPKDRTMKARRPEAALIEFIRDQGAPEDIPDRELSFDMATESNKGRLHFDSFGNFEWVKKEPETGFWQYLKNRQDPFAEMHPSFFIHGTVTGRASSREPNGQNLPKRGPLAKAYRKIFVPPPGYQFIEVDLSQAELRIAAWMANETEMIRIYNEGGDIHSATAAAVMGISENKFNEGRANGAETLLMDVANQWPGSGPWLKELSPGKRRQTTLRDFLDYKRFAAKAVNFGLLYGMGWRKFQIYARTEYRLSYTDAEAQHIVDVFFQKYPRLRVWHDSMRDFVQKHGYVRSLHGAKRRLPNVYSDDDKIVNMALRQAINSPVQRFASDLGLIALCRFVRDATLADMAPCLFIHDANILAARTDIVEEAACAMKFYMETPPLGKWFNLTPPLPITADISIGPNLCDMDEREELEAVRPSWYQAGEEPPVLDQNVAQVWKKKKRRGIILTD